MIIIHFKVLVRLGIPCERKEYGKRISTDESIFRMFFWRISSSIPSTDFAG